MTLEVLHITHQLSSGGAGKALEALASAAKRSSHRVVSLLPATAAARTRLSAQAIPLLEQPRAIELNACMSQADVVQIHFWNTPELYGLMTLEHNCRLVIWSHVEGSTAPHILIPEIVNYCQALVHSCRQTDPMAISIRPSSPHRFALRSLPPGDAVPLVVGIFGSLHSSRMCTEALEVFTQAACPDSSLLVVGQGDLVPRWQRLACELNLHERVEFRGFVSNVGRELARMDVLLHLPKPGCFATADLALQEALMAGVVPVVLSGTPVADLVQHNVDGLIAMNLHQCVEHLQTLDGDRQLLARLRTAAQTRANREFSSDQCTNAFEHLYEQICEHPRAPRRLQLEGGSSGNQRFMASLGVAAAPFRISAERAAGWQEADRQIAASSAALVGAGAGGILHWRGAYPNDPLLRYWAGLVFNKAGRSALAAAEFSAAAKAGLIGAAERLERCRCQA
jgi:glycosyltransferase involved in cell wall biosynthesis